MFYQIQYFLTNGFAKLVCLAAYIEPVSAYISREIYERSWNRVSVGWSEVGQTFCRPLCQSAAAKEGREEWDERRKEEEREEKKEEKEGVTEERRRERRGERRKKARRERREGGAELRKAFTQAANRAHCVLSERPHRIPHLKNRGQTSQGYYGGCSEAGSNRI